MNNDNIIIEIKNLQKIFLMGRMKVKALSDISFTVKAGEFIALQGASGAGKSTLLHIIGGLDHATGGSIKINGTKLQNLNEDELTLFRKDNIGFIFQFFNLIPTLNSVENVIISHMFDSTENIETNWKNAEELLTKIGLEHRLDHRPQELSGGEQQRIAIARALLNKPVLLLADEPTGNIDTQSGKQIMELFKQQNQEGTTVIVATHNDEIAGFANRRLLIKDGKLIDE